MQVGTTEDQGLYNKPSAAVHPVALAAGTLPQYSTIQYVYSFVSCHSLLPSPLFKYCPLHAVKIIRVCSLHVLQSE